MSDITNKNMTYTIINVQRKTDIYIHVTSLSLVNKLWILNQSLSFIYKASSGLAVEASIRTVIHKTWRWLAWSPTLKRTVPFCVWYRWDPRPPSPVEQHNFSGHFDNTHHKMASIAFQAVVKDTFCYSPKTQVMCLKPTSWG